MFSSPAQTPVVCEPTYAAFSMMLYGSDRWISNVQLCIKAGLLALELIHVAVPPLFSEGSKFGTVTFDAGNPESRENAGVIPEFVEDTAGTAPKPGAKTRALGLFKSP